MREFLVSIVLGVVMLFSSTALQTTPASMDLVNIEEVKQEMDMGESVSEDEVIKAILKEEYEKNSQYDIAGVIYVKDFVFDVVMMPTDNDDYLHASRDGEYLREGELFLSDLSNFRDNKSLDMTRIYGHNMATGRKFGLLNRLHNKDNGRPMYFYDGEKTTKYNVARSFKFVDGTETFERYDLTPNQKKDFLERVTANYTVSHLNQFDPDKDVVFLQTCETASGLRRDVVTYVEEGVI